MSSKRLTGADILRSLHDPARPVRVIAWRRKESEPCEANTPGCSIDHTRDHGSCDTW